MNKIGIRFILWGMLVSCAFSGYAQEAVVSQSFWETTKQKVGEFRENLLVQWFGMWGSELPLDPAMEALVKEVIAELNIPNGDQIRIRRMSRLGILMKGKKNAFIVDIPGLPKYMFISEKFFRKLSKEEQKAIIGHELIHLKHRHGAKKIAMGLGGTLTILGSAILAYHLIVKDNLDNYYISTLFNESIGLAFILFGLGQTALSRTYEYQADEEAVKALGCYDGAIGLLEKLKKHEDKIINELPAVIQQQIKAPINKAFATHPETSDRIAKIQQLKEAAQAPAAA